MIPTLFRPRRLPSYSQFCRRLTSPRVLAMIELVNAKLAGGTGATPQPCALGFFDGKPLIVSDNSRDPDARIGRDAGAFRRGDKLHDGGPVPPSAWARQDLRVAALAVTPLNAGEPVVAREQLVSSS